MITYIRHKLEEELLIPLIRSLIAHKRICITYKGKDMFIVEIVPARHGQVYGNGYKEGAVRKPKFDFRLRFKVTNDCKALIQHYIDLEV